MLRLLYLVPLLITSNGEVSSRKRVCVIGAGRAGLAAVKLVADEMENFEVIAFERNSDVGGLWIYRDNIMYPNEHGYSAQTGIYKNLITNVPKRFMAYPDYSDIRSEGESNNIPHAVFLNYMRNYTDHFQLRKYIKFDTLVTRVIPEGGEFNWRTTTWRVDLRDLKSDKKNFTFCDAVILCNGRHSKPYTPRIPGLWTFPGQILHSRSYRKPEDFSNRTVIILGAGNSGVDIAIDLNGHAKKIYLSHKHERDPFYGILHPNNVEVVRGVVSAEGNQFTLQDNSTIVADTFIFCTGYSLDYPFLDSRSGIVVVNKEVRSLYLEALNMEHPSMIIIGLPNASNYGALYYDQVKWFLGLLQDKQALLKYESLLEREKNFYTFLRDYLKTISVPKM